MLLRLPSELVHMVIKQLHTRDLKAICRTSRELNQIAIPLLYETITLQFDENLRLMPRFNSLLSLRKSFFKHTRNLILEKDMSRKNMEVSLVEAKCAHWGEIFDSDDDEWGDELLAFLRMVEKDSLLKFAWNLKMCALDVIFGESGHLSTQQRRITSLCLVNNEFCSRDGDEAPLMEATGLQSLSWKTIHSLGDFDCFRSWIHASRDTLEKLGIDVGSQRELAKYKSAEGVPISYFLSFKRASVLDRLPRLRNLSLSRVSFEEAGSDLLQAKSDLLQALNFGFLRSLTLWHCVGLSGVLQALTDSDLEIRLTSLEVFENPNGADLSTAKNLAIILSRFTGLKDLYMLLWGTYPWGSIPWDDICSGIRSHQQSLKRLILHERQEGPNGGEGPFDDGYDKDVSWGPEGLDTLIPGSRIDCLGVSNESAYLLAQLVCLNPKPQCRILHLRSSRDNTGWWPESTNPSSRSHSASPPSHSVTAFANTNPIDNASPYVPGTTWTFPATLSALADEQTDDVADYDMPKENTANDNSHSCRDENPVRSIGPKGLEDLAEWAFGSSGLPNLQIIAYGDFSYRGRYEENTTLLCRNESGVNGSFGPSFRRLKDDDYFLQDLVRENMEMLGACAVDYC